MTRFEGREVCLKKDEEIFEPVKQFLKIKCIYIKY
ncbi:hypothetical protein Slin_1869 [Spirosoma linguale DSM 74]|uniref:Uncharacterized protein n=1 Tax=Spirosoma linguale (strain ATCC 33905 / DSM 74 / LMG 10896 / Claus 1) TaxID=504472 RepID=D2QBN5_SPILD|nr:hypothetical protein Slin_1869 [Spirosoma linguale DSM 74]